MDFGISTEEYFRAYFLSNMYLSQIQHGIQAAHVVAEMALEFGNNKYFKKWAEQDKTIVILNGGFQSELKIFRQIIEKSQLLSSLPNSYFCEESDALNNAWTSVGIILPESIWNIDPKDSYSLYECQLKYGDESDNIKTLLDFMNKKRLA